MKFLKIRDIFYKGDRGGENKLSRENAIATHLKLDAMIKAMTDAQKGRYEANLGENKEFVENTIERYKNFNKFVEDL